MKHLNYKFSLYGILFFCSLFFFATINSIKLVRFWVYDETDYNEWNVSMESQLETDYITNFYGKMQFVNLNGALRNLLNQSEMNGVIKLNNGYLLKPIEAIPNEILQKNANAVIALKQYLEEQNIPLIFAVTPYTSSKYDSQLPIGIEDYGNDNIDYFVECLKAGNVKVMDYRQIMYDEGIDQYKLMYKTDHHWTMQGGFYAYTKLAEELEKIMNCHITPSIKDINNYTITKYNQWHLGSRGQKTGIYFAGIDDFDLITPNFETSLNREDISGSFFDLIINMEPLENKEYTSRYTYDWVLKDGLHNYTNNKSINNKKIIIMTDSMGKAVNPFLALSFSEVRSLSNEISSDLNKDLIDAYEPDAVILLYYPENLGNTGAAFSFLP